MYYLIIVIALFIFSPNVAEAKAYKKTYKKTYYSKTYKRNYRTANYGRFCSCVNYARAITGINVGRIGYARNHPINSREPQAGALIITSESWAGHLAVVTSVNGDSITLTEANYRRCQRSSRTISKHSSFIRGYYVR